MTGEKENREYYRKTFEEVHASEELLRKVEDMGMEFNRKKGTRILRRSCVAAAALAVALISSNMISYAATGSPWIITLTTADGTELSTEPGVHYLEDGTVYSIKYLPEDHAIEVEESASGDEAVEIECTLSQGVEAENETTENAATGSIIKEGSELLEHSRIVQEGKKIFFQVDEVCRIDITEDFAAGSCRGVFEANGREYQYIVTGTPEENSIQIIAPQ